MLRSFLLPDSDGATVVSLDLYSPGARPFLVTQAGYQRGKPAFVWFVDGPPEAENGDPVFWKVRLWVTPVLTDREGLVPGPGPEEIGAYLGGYVGMDGQKRMAFLLNDKPGLLNRPPADGARPQQLAQPQRPAPRATSPSAPLRAPETPSQTSPAAQSASSPGSSGAQSAASVGGRASAPARPASSGQSAPSMRSDERGASSPGNSVGPARPAQRPASPPNATRPSAPSASPAAQGARPAAGP